MKDPNEALIKRNHAVIHRERYYTGFEFRVRTIWWSIVEPIRQFWWRWTA